MKKLIVMSAVVIFTGFFTSCQKCMTCDVNYRLPAGEVKRDLYPETCGQGLSAEDKEQELKDAYSSYDSVNVTCTPL